MNKELIFSYFTEYRNHTYLVSNDRNWWKYNKKFIKERKREKGNNPAHEVNAQGVLCLMENWIQRIKCELCLFCIGCFCFHKRYSLGLETADRYYLSLLWTWLLISRLALVHDSVIYESGFVVLLFFFHSTYKIASPIMCQTISWWPRHKKINEKLFPSICFSFRRWNMALITG